jgi:ABC-type transport system involved in cytochrome c biogenesis permease subunit
MRRIGWLTLGLVLSLSALAAAPRGSAADEPKPKALGIGPAYDELAKLSVLHDGRKKPFDTFAREEVKQIFGRETIKILDAARENKVTETWGPVAALFDWSVRPEVWDDLPFILVEYVSLKRLILAEAIKARLGAAADKLPDSLDSQRQALKKVATDPNLSADVLRRWLGAQPSTFPSDERKAIEDVAAELSEEHKWLSPRQLEEAKVTAEGSGGQPQPFDAWFQAVVQKKRQADASTTGEIKLTEVEKRAIEVGTRLVHYQAIRDREMRSVEPLLIMPRPSNKAYLAFLAKTYEKAQKTRDVAGLAPLELDGAKALDTYWNELPIEDRAVPGTNEEFDKLFVAWLGESSAWIPLKALLDSKPEVLVEAGFPSEKVAAFLIAFKDLEKAEDAAPGTVSASKTSALVVAARALGESVSPTNYPTGAAIDRETYFNAASPFFKAPVGYMCAVALLAACLGFQGFERRSVLSQVGQALYVLGILGLVSGIALEVFGFYLRVQISGWAPVTNMYETVIWVSAVSAVLGLALEMVYRRTYAALAGSMVALLGTVLAANVPLLDPDIKTLQPVLRSNYWLTIHVLTEVSSYGAFLMAAGLGLIGTMYYLTATYRRSPSFTELLLPAIPGIPMLAVGLAGTLAANGYFGPGWMGGGNIIMLLCGGLAFLGGAFVMAVPIALVGEVVSRSTFHEEAELDQAALTGEARAQAPAGDEPAVSPGTVVQTVIVGESLGSGAESKVTKPTVAEIRALAQANRPKLDARGRAMQETAAKIKPISNFIYRSMQVGVLLIAAGTILGGIWADYSWGRFWGWDPKEVWALITLLVYLIPLHGRFAGWFNTFALVFASVVCSLSVIMAWYGVNFVLGVGLHSYGFVEGGGQGIVMSVLSGVMAFPVAAAWRRHLGLMPARAGA